jgi:hypothetical protein
MTESTELGASTHFQKYVSPEVLEIFVGDEVDIRKSKINRIYNLSVPIGGLMTLNEEINHKNIDPEDVKFTQSYSSTLKSCLLRRLPSGQIAFNKITPKSRMSLFNCIFNINNSVSTLINEEVKLLWKEFIKVAPQTEDILIHNSKYSWHFPLKK